MSSSTQESQAIRTLRLRFREIEPKVEQALGKQDEISLQYLFQHDSWSVRACGLQLCLEKLKNNEISFDLALDGCLKNVDFEEVRTRLETLPLIEELARKDPSKTWDVLGEKLTQVAEENMHLDEEQRGEDAERRGMKETGQEEEERDAIFDPRLPIELEISRTKLYSSVNLSDFRGRVRANSSGASARVRLDSGAVVLMVHETVGWKALETSLKGLNSLMLGYGKDFISKGFLTERLIKLFHDVLEHENRFVREVGFEIIQTVSKLTQDEFYRADLYYSCALGMCDSKSSQVRLKALIAANNLIQTQSGQSETERELTEKVLGPSICLNRHYSAEGLRRHAQECWKLAFPSNGKAVIQKHFDVFAKFYVQELQTSGDDFCREAACFALSEILQPELLPEGYLIKEVFRAVLNRMKDNSFGVRCAACYFLGDTSSRLATEISNDISRALQDTLTDRLCDPIGAVREEAAIAIGKFIRGLLDPPVAEEAFQTFENLAVEWLRLHKTHHKHEHHGKDSNHETAQHSNQIMFACCSTDVVTAQNLSRKDQPVHQQVNGALRLTRELLQIKPSENLMNELVEFIRSLGINPQDTHHVDLEVTLWNILIDIAKSLGKRPFKRYLDEIIPYAAKSLKQSSNKGSYQAALFFNFLRQFIGEGILKARCESISLDLWSLVENNPPTKFERPTISFRST